MGGRGGVSGIHEGGAKVDGVVFLIGAFGREGGAYDRCRGGRGNCLHRLLVRGGRGVLASTATCLAHVWFFKHTAVERMGPPRRDETRDRQRRRSSQLPWTHTVWRNSLDVPEQ